MYYVHLDSKFYIKETVLMGIFEVTMQWKTQQKSGT